MTKPLQQSIRAAVQKAWSDTVSTISGIEQEMGRRLRGIRLRTDIPQSGEEIHRGIRELGRRLQQNSEIIEQRVEESLRTVLERIRAPLVEELNGLRNQAEQIGHRIEVLLRKQDPEGTQTRPPGSDRSGDDPSSSP